MSKNQLFKHLRIEPRADPVLPASAVAVPPALRFMLSAEAMGEAREFYRRLDDIHWR